MRALNPNSVQVGLGQSTTPAKAPSTGAMWGQSIGAFTLGAFAITQNVLSGLAWKKELDYEKEERTSYNS